MVGDEKREKETKNQKVGSEFGVMITTRLRGKRSDVKNDLCHGPKKTDRQGSICSTCVAIST